MLINVFGHWVNPNLVRYVDSEIVMGTQWCEVIFDKNHKVTIGKKSEKEVAEEINRLVKEQNASKAERFISHPISQYVCKKTGQKVDVIDLNACVQSSNIMSGESVVAYIDRTYPPETQCVEILSRPDFFNRFKIGE